MKVWIKKHATLILCSCILALALIIWFMQRIMAQSGEQVIVEADGSIYGTYNLSQNQEIEIQSGTGYNLLVIEEGQAYIKQADCQNQVCVHTQAISKGGQSIVCLPHKVVIRIESERGSEVDAVTN